MTIKENMEKFKKLSEHDQKEVLKLIRLKNEFKKQEIERKIKVYDELLDYLKQKDNEFKKYVCIYEEKLRNTKKEDYYYNSHLNTIHKFNAQRELIKEILSKIEKR